MRSQELTGIEFSSTSSLGARWVTLSHDASSINSLLGNPTSVLSFGPIASKQQEFSVTYTNNFGDAFTGGVWAGRTFTSVLVDDDFYAGQIPLQQTFSIVQPASFYGVSLGAKSRDLGDPFGSALEVRAITKLEASHMTLMSTGLTCGEVCSGVPKIATTTPVLTHDFKSLVLTGGIQTTHIIDSSARLNFSISAGPGWSEIKDTHHLRTDLGPAPHVIYTLFGPNIDMDLFYQNKINDNLSASIGIEGSASWEFGAVQFAPNTPSPFSPLPGFASNYAVKASLRIDGKF